MGVMKCFISKLHKVIALQVLLRESWQAATLRRTLSVWACKGQTLGSTPHVSLTLKRGHSSAVQLVLKHDPTEKFKTNENVFRFFFSLLS